MNAVNENIRLWKQDNKPKYVKALCRAERKSRVSYFACHKAGHAGFSIKLYYKQVK